MGIRLSDNVMRNNKTEDVMQEQEKLLKEIMQPDVEFTPIPFWFFNDTFEEERVKNQLADYVEKGVNGIVLHPRIGVPKEMP